MKLMRKEGGEVNPHTCPREELEKVGKYLAALDEKDAHVCSNSGHCQPFAGTRCGELGRELHRIREIWRQRNAARWGAPVPPLRPPTPAHPQTVPPGHYALQQGNGMWTFYKVDHGKGKWKGYTFIVQVVGDHHSRISRYEQNQVLSQITQDVMKALTDYGKQIGACGHCNRRLTDSESIARGIGPVCAGKVGLY